MGLLASGLPGVFYAAGLLGLLELSSRISRLRMLGGVGLKVPLWSRVLATP